MLCEPGFLMDNKIEDPETCNPPRLSLDLRGMCQWSAVTVSKE